MLPFFRSLFSKSIPNSKHVSLSTTKSSLPKLFKKNELDISNSSNFHKISPSNQDQQDDEDPNTYLRTIIDNSLKHEDVFKNIIKYSNKRLPPQNEFDKDKITLFIPLDQVLVYTYIPDENMGMQGMPNFREYDLRVELPEYKTFAFVYYRDYLEEFLNYIDEKFEPILYATGEKSYVDKIMEVIDPNGVFRYRLYQDNCHLFKDFEQDHVQYLKDINLFTNRSLKRKLLIDYEFLNYTISPDNGK